MISTILGFLATIITAFGYGTIYYAAYVFWSVVILYIAKKKGYEISVNTKDVDNAKDIQKEKTEK